MSTQSPFEKYAQLSQFARRQPACLIGHAPWNGPEHGYVAVRHVRKRYAENLKDRWEEDSDFTFTVCEPSFLDEHPDLAEADNADDFTYDPYSFGA